ncbi:MAG: nucleotidyltransferase domain-containing protein [Chthoniobacterales bacterium]
MSVDHGIPTGTLQQITDVLAQFPEVDQAILFGSRAKGTHRRVSDIDLALVGHALDRQTIGRIDAAFDDLPTPYGFSLVIIDERLAADVAAHIRRVGIPLFRRHAVLVPV